MQLPLHSVEFAIHKYHDDLQTNGEPSWTVFQRCFLSLISNFDGSLRYDTDGSETIDLNELVYMSCAPSIRSR